MSIAFNTPISTFSAFTHIGKQFTARTHPAYVTVYRSQRAVVKAATTLSAPDSMTMDSMTMDKFWEYADETKTSTQYESDRKISFLKEASFEEIKKVCLQYRYFVTEYPKFLCWLVAKLPYGELKSLMGEILAEELGSGNEKSAHIVWYDNFLRSLGITNEILSNGIYPENQKILGQIEGFCHERGHEFIVGMIGMGGECLCQIYLTSMHKYLSENEAIKAMGKKIDWTFWSFHIGDEDIKHREMVRKAISNAAVNKNGVRELFLGYTWGKSTWDQFWANNYKETRVVH